MVQQLAQSVAEEVPDGLTLPGLIIVPPPKGSAYSDEELERLDTDNPGWRFEVGCDGELVINMGSGGVTGDIELEIGGQLRNWRRAGGGGRARSAQSGYWLGGEPGAPPEMEPDLSWVSDDQLDSIPPEFRALRGYWAVCPAFIMEIRSPDDSLEHQRAKMRVWMQYGVQLGWLVDPRSLTVEIYRPGREPELLERPTNLSGEDVLQGLTVDLSEVWTLAEEG